MKPRVGDIAIVQSVHEADVREINALEQRIVKSEDDADAKLWEQARQVVNLLEAGMTQRALAKQWVNARTGEAYSQAHVKWTLAAFEQFTTQPRPRFRDAYNEVANAKPSNSDGSGDSIRFDFGAALNRIHDVLIKTYDSASGFERKQLVSDLRAFLNTIETRKYE